jgi:hypothetical protein
MPADYLWFPLSRLMVEAGRARLRRQEHGSAATQRAKLDSPTAADLMTVTLGTERRKQDILDVGAGLRDWPLDVNARHPRSRSLRRGAINHITAEDLET